MWLIQTVNNSNNNDNSTKGFNDREVNESVINSRAESEESVHSMCFVNRGKYLQTLLFYLFEWKRFFPRIIMEGSKWCDRMRIYVDFRAVSFACWMLWNMSAQICELKLCCDNSIKNGENQISSILGNIKNSQFLPLHTFVKFWWFMTLSSTLFKGFPEINFHLP